METAKWNGKVVSARQISKNYTLEKQIREASGRKELFCPDEYCENPIVRYCNGPKKLAYFAHLDTTNCDYETFEKENNKTTRKLRELIFNQFSEKGYNVCSEVKLLKHHYAQLFVVLEDNRKIAIEFMTKNTSANKIKHLMHEYQSQQIEMKILVIGEQPETICEEHTSFVNRFLLNDSKNKDLLIIDEECTNLVQYRLDTYNYLFEGRSIESKNYPHIYCKKATICDLFLEEGELSLLGFNKQYQTWFNKKQLKFKEKLEELQKEKNANLLKQASVKKIPSFNNTSYHLREFSHVAIGNDERKQSTETIKSKEERYAEILPRMNQVEEIVKDSAKQRWIKCERCGLIDTDENFSVSGGRHEQTLGLCRKCMCGR